MKSVTYHISVKMDKNGGFIAYYNGTKTKRYASVSGAINEAKQQTLDVLPNAKFEISLVEV